MAGAPGEIQEACSWALLRWIARGLQHAPVLPRPANVTGTILKSSSSVDRRPRVGLCLQHHPDDVDGPPFLLDLPIDLAGACRVALECDRERSGCGPLMSSPATWTVYCNGRRVGYGTRRPATEAEARALQAVRAVSAGAGILPPPHDVAYLRGRFERVVGSADSESYHLLNPAGCFGQDEISFFFLRV